MARDRFDVLSVGIRRFFGKPARNTFAVVEKVRSDLLKLLPIKERNLFWTSIWELANEPDKLKEYDIEAIYGNVVYSKLKKGFIYVFKITPAGQLYPETVPEM